MLNFWTLPTVLAEAGYTSFMAGKFWESRLEDAGFAEGVMPTRMGVFRISDLGRPSIDPVLQFLDQGREPFLLWFAPQLPHSPFDASEEYLTPFRGRDLSPSAMTYYANVARFDAVLGQLMAALEERGLRERTLVVYLADNGWEQAPKARNEGLGGSHGKRSIYEAGFRTPIIFSWPGRVAANVTRDDLVSSVDIVPTLLDYAAVSAPDWLPGHSLYSVLERGAPWVRKQVFGWTVSLRLDQPDGGRADKSFAPAAFVRGRRWRYIWRPRAKVDELYDMDSDPGESRNLAPSSPDVASRHRESIEEWMRNMREGVRVMEAELDAQGTESTNP